jgi:hypothetical protein
MGFGLNIKVEAPKVETPKVDVAAAASQAASSVTGAVSGAMGAAMGAVSGAVGAVTGAVEGAVAGVAATASGAAAALSSVAGAIADVDVSFKGAAEDFVLEPHLQLDANASYGKTKFEKGPIWIRIELTPDEAKLCTDTLHLFSESGEYDAKQKISDYKDNNETTVVIVFEKAPMDEKYSLEIIPEGGEPRVVLSRVPYGDLFKTKGEHLN